MLAPAQLHEEELNKKILEIWYKEKYMFWNNSIFHSISEIPKDTWNTHDFVVLNNHDEVIGRISYEVERSEHQVCNMSIINFSEDIIAFGYDLRKVIDDIFIKFGFRKMKYCVIVGNPVEKNYDKLTGKYGGRVVGIYHKDVKLMDGQLYDCKVYELLREDYIRNRRMICTK